jgi:uncharacterized protein YndB with AHSA1/START domain
MGLLTRVIGETVSITWQLELDAESTWRHLVDLDNWPAWLGSPIEGSLHPGAQLIVDHGDGYLCTSEVESVESEQSLVMSWSFPDEHRTWLELTVSRTGEGGSVVALSHHELGALSSSYSVGWLVHLTYFEASAMGVPLPMSQFWRIHQTLNALASETLSND